MLGSPIRVPHDRRNLAFDLRMGGCPLQSLPDTGYCPERAGWAAGARGGRVACPSPRRPWPTSWGGREAAGPALGSLASDTISSRRLNPSSGSTENWVSSHRAGSPGSCWGKSQSHQHQHEGQSPKPPARGSGPAPNPTRNSGPPCLVQALREQHWPKLCTWNLVKASDPGL